MELSGCSYVAVVPKTCIECKFVAKALNLSMRLLQKDKIKQEVAAKAGLTLK